MTNNRNTVFLEYAWNVAPSFNGVKCDPCVGDPPMLTEFQQAGVSWLNGNPGASVFFTRMHVRYSRDKFPQDLMFQLTPNTENYQARYIITHPATDLDCIEGKKYLQKLETRKLLEVMTYCRLTGDAPYQYGWYAPMIQDIRKDQGSNRRIKVVVPEDEQGSMDSFLGSGDLNAADFTFTGGEENHQNENKPLLLLLIPFSLLLISALHKIRWSKKE